MLSDLNYIKSHINFTGFFPFGVENNDTLTSQSNRDSFGPIVIDTPIVFFQGKEDVLFVRTSFLVMDVYIFSKPIRSYC